MIISPFQRNIKEAVCILREGKLVGLPTETVYGLAADATQENAVAQIFEVKNRPTFNPLIIHGSSIEIFQKQVLWNDKADLLARTYWPGPLTFVLPRRNDSSLSHLASAGLPSVALRMPNHPVALALLNEFGGLLAAPSANLSGKISPTQASHVNADFPDLWVLEGGPCAVGLESTIIDLTGDAPVLLRPGGIPQEEIEQQIGPLARLAENIIKAPGMMASHYAPSRPLRLNVQKPLRGEAFLAFGESPYEGEYTLNLSAKGDLREAASNLFRMLRLLDRSCFQRIAVAPIPSFGLGSALNDRLTRAAAPVEP
jgi:L-threonylcarbamoyladenylate synthase